ncbi:MAG: hypothetical protein EAZ09_25500 [Oscillatoriales cyanobacterium]|nr:MAG: hypothetical protein EAZ18_21735 [Oscillatoriales cyanobacterium]TAH15018.1 MAG: hypothetical protein EAZ09_25500 [Oscillatoriales cyanobacterium]
MVSGLFSCPHCHSHLVISWSGNFVRDPFSLKQLTVGKMLRRESRPLARIQRDLGIGKRLPLVALLGSAVFLGFAIASTDQSLTRSQPFQGFLEWVSGSRNSQDVSR